MKRVLAVKREEGRRADVEQTAGPMAGIFDE